MIEKEIAELRRRFRPDRSGVSHVRGCYVNANGEIISQFDERKLYHKRAEIAFLDAQICYSQHLFKGAGYNYEKCIEYMEKYTEEAPEAKDLNILALASYLLGSMNRGSPDIPLLKKAFTIWSELAKSEGGEEYAKRRDEVAAILVRHML